MEKSIGGRGCLEHIINRIRAAAKVSLPWAVFLCLFLLQDVNLLHASPPKPRPFKIAVLHCGDVVKSFELYTPLVRYLADQTGFNIELAIMKDIAGLERSLQAGEIDFVLQDSPHYVRYNAYYNRDLLLKEITLDGKDTVTGMVIVRKDSPYQRIEDLADKKVQFGPTSSGVKWAAGRELFAEHGVLPDKNLKIYVGAGGCCEEIAFNVYFKKVDAGVICDHALQKIGKKGVIKIGELRTIGLTATIPSPVFAAAKHVAPDIVKAVMAACLSLDRTNPQYSQILSSMDLNAFAPTKDAAYDSLRNIVP
ncbi:MAG: hypothetical protein A2521_09240 [Deltaproteobacteria bacterium RIFOXYD12_FULL_57_12]|nr:MAG: hypothetical protein A2521_09240 [Deltaproteobacteria bacterium RIFOXYD12_FULL_57_12]